MKFKFYLFTFLLLGLTACGGKQLVWVDKDTGADTAVSQPSLSADEDEEAGDPAENMMSGEMAAGSKAMTGVTTQSEAAIKQNEDDASTELSDEARLAIELMAEVPEVAEWLTAFPDWTGDAWQDESDGRFYSIDLYSEAADEWLGWGYVNVADGVVEEYFVPRELTAAEFQIGREQVEQFVFSDEELLARLGDVAKWEHETWYNRWDANWEVWFWYGLEELAVTVSLWEDELYLEGIYNPAEFEAEEAAENSKNQAIELAWQAEGIDQALAGEDNWQTYVSQQGDTVWAVSFTTTDKELFYALVDIDSWQVLESE